MNMSQLRYRIAIGGLTWIGKTALGMARQALETTNTAKPAFELGSKSESSPRILYIHSGWAIETVGRLWLTEQKISKVTFIRTGDPLLTPEFIKGFDFVWYGYSSLFGQYPCDPSKAILAVHDPAELFPERSDWKNSCMIEEKHLERLRNVKAVVVISREMQQVLEKVEVRTFRIPTCSQMALRNEEDISINDPACLLAVGRIYRRKNFEQYKRIALMAKKQFGLRGYFKGDHFPLSEAQYIRLLDQHSIYLCTSFQEGGPLPVMDAMRRGAVVISTQVGQIPEIIDHGVNGFICGSDIDFMEVISNLAADPNYLYSMRIASLRHIQQVRNEPDLQRDASLALSHILGKSMI